MRTFWTVAKQSVRQWLADDAFSLAAALSFYTVISLAPLVTLSLAVASLFYGERAVRGQLVEQIEHVVGEPGAEVIQGILAHAHAMRPGLMGLVSVVILLVGASFVFVQLQRSLNAVWNVAPRPDLTWRYTLKGRLLSMLLVLCLGLLLLLVTIAATALEYVTALVPAVGIVWHGVNFLAGIALVTLLFAALFKLLPDAVVAWRDVWVGALVTALLFEIGRHALAVYLGRSAPGSAYGASGSLVALLLWIYYSALIILLGAEFAQVYARRFGHRIRPSVHAYRTTHIRLPVDDEGRPQLDENLRKLIREHVNPDAS